MSNAKSKTPAKKPKQAKTRKAPAGSDQQQPALPTPPRPQTAFRLDDKELEKALATGEHAGILEDYFGQVQYHELRQLARQAAARSVRGGPRVLIVPGIMGSKIGKKRILFDDVIWIDPFDIAAGNLEDLRLNGADPDLTALGVILFAYLKLKLSLRSAGYDADFHPFDWRQSLTKLGQDLAERVQNERAKKVHIVAHSMGGLVTRAAVARDAAKIDRIVMLGTPNFGSFAPVQVLRAVYPVVQKVAFIDTQHSPKDLVMDVFRTFPGLYQMLPWPEKFGLLDLYSLASWPTSRPRPLEDLLKEARAVQQTLAPADDRFFLIAGVNQETAVAIRRENDEFAYDFSMEGDGTVPLAMAELPGAKTYFVEESHGSLPNNTAVARAVKDLLATGATTALPDRWSPVRSGVTKSLRDSALPAPEYERAASRSLSTRQQRLLLEELVAPVARAERATAPSPIAPAPQPSADQDYTFQRLVIGRQLQHRLEIRLAFGSIVDVDAQAYVLGMFRDVTPAGASRIIDTLLEGVITDFVKRRMFTGNVGEISIIPTGRHPVRADMVAFAGLGAFDQFNYAVLELVAENLIRTFLKTKVDDFATVLFGGASGGDPAPTLFNMLQGFIRGLRDADVFHRFQGLTICETDRDRYDAIKQEIYRLSGTPLFEEIQVVIDEIPMPPPREPRVYGPPEVRRRRQIYLIMRCEKLQDEALLGFEASVLTAGAKATVFKGRSEVSPTDLDKHLEKIRSSGFTFGKLQGFGRQLAELVLTPDMATVLSRYPDDHLVIVHDALSSRIPWETMYVDVDSKQDSFFPAARGGLSRRYLADNLSVAKWLANRQHGDTLDVLLVINPTEDLNGAKQEGDRIQELFGGYASSVKLTVLEGAQAQKSTLLSHFSSGAYDVIHYAGHAYFDSDFPPNSGILCAGQQVLSGAELAGVGNLPSLLFFNACEAGRIREPQQKDKKGHTMVKRIQRNVGLAEAFLRGGVANYLGTYWPVGDAPAKQFAEVFYGELLRGESVGDALLKARQKVQTLKSVDWADYVLYGNPDFSVKTAAA